RACTTPVTNSFHPALARPSSISIDFFLFFLHQPPRSTLFPYTTLFRSHVLPLSHHDLPLRLQERRDQRLQGAHHRLRSVPVRDEAGVLHEQGRHAGPHVHHV